ncbi:MAG: FCD domain-containing protein [Planctomycetes bacterium]|nr:FCD domain-containing protein [Planctomycetota bacterium]
MEKFFRRASWSKLEAILVLTTLVAGKGNARKLNSWMCYTLEKTVVLLAFYEIRSRLLDLDFSAALRSEFQEHEQELFQQIKILEDESASDEEKESARKSVVAADKCLHRKICRLARNPACAWKLRKLSNRSDSAFEAGIDLEPDQVRDIIDEHRELVRPMLMPADPATAIRALRQHKVKSLARLIAATNHYHYL